MASATWPMARHAYHPTQSDTDDLPTPSTAGIWVSATGDIQLTTESGNTVLYGSIPAGAFLPVVAKRIWDTNTTLTNAQIVINVAG